LVFVHGIFGDTLDTWRNKSTGKHFYDPFGKLNGKVLKTGRPHGDGLLLFAPRHFYLLAESVLEELFEASDERWRFALGALWVAALSRLELVLFRGPARTDLILLRRRPRREGIVAHAGLVVRAMVLNL
jgi:hypothetical protein